jgi:hypothetical protein
MRDMKEAFLKHGPGMLTEGRIFKYPSRSFDRFLPGRKDLAFVGHTLL